MYMHTYLKEILEYVSVIISINVRCIINLNVSIHLHTSITIHESERTLTMIGSCQDTNIHADILDYPASVDKTHCIEINQP